MLSVTNTALGYGVFLFAAITDVFRVAAVCVSAVPRTTLFNVSTPLHACANQEGWMTLIPSLSASTTQISNNYLFTTTTHSLIHFILSFLYCTLFVTINTIISLYILFSYKFRYLLNEIAQCQLISNSTYLMKKKKEFKS